MSPLDLSRAVPIASESRADFDGWSMKHGHREREVLVAIDKKSSGK